MPCLSDLVVERRNTSNAPYSQNEQQKESSFLKEFYAYQKKQMEELAAYSETSATDINKAKIAGRYLLQPAANVNLFKSGDAELQAATPSSSKEVSYSDLKTRNIELADKQYDLKTQNIELSQPQYDLKTANITLTDTSDIYKALSTHTVPESEYSFSKLYGNLTTLNNNDLFKNGEGFYSNWHTSPISYVTNDGITERLLAEKSNVPLYDVIASQQYGSKYDYYSLAYNNRSIMAAVGLKTPYSIYQAVDIYKDALYDYSAVLPHSIDGNGIAISISGVPTYQPMQLVDAQWNLYSNSRLTTEANLSSVGIYNPVGAWEDDEQAFLHRIPLLGDLQQRVSDLEGSSILWQAFYNKKSSDPLQIYKMANVNTNVIYMTGRFIPQPPIANDVRFVTDIVPSALKGKVAGAVDSLMGGIPSYPYIPLPYAMPQYKKFTIGQQPNDVIFSLYDSYIWNLNLEQNNLLEGHGELALKYSRSLTPFEKISEHSQKIKITNWNAEHLAELPISKYKTNGWKPLGDLQNNAEYFDKEAKINKIPSYYPSEFGYEQLADFEGHTSVYDLEIKVPSNLTPTEALDGSGYLNLPPFACAKDGSLQGQSLAHFTSITAIPDVELKSGVTYSLGEFGAFLLSTNYMNYVSTIQTKTLETAECDCYKWAQNFLSYFYGTSTPNLYMTQKYRHRSLYQSYYIITISKIFFGKSIAMPIKRHIISKDFYGVPTFNLTEQINDSRLQEIPIVWQIIGQSNEIVATEQNIPDL